MGRPLRLIEPDRRVERTVRERGPMSAHEVAEALRAEGFEWPVPTPCSRYRGANDYDTVPVTAAHVNGSLKQNWNLERVKPVGRPPQWQYREEKR